MALIVERRSGEVVFLIMSMGFAWVIARALLRGMAQKGTCFKVHMKYNFKDASQVAPNIFAPVLR